MTYQGYIVEQIKNIKAGVPIYTAPLAELLAQEYSLDIQKANNCFLLLYHCNRNRQIPFRNLLANHRFAVEILEFRLSIVVMVIALK